MKFILKLFFACFLLLFIFKPVSVFAEQINSFDSVIVAHKNGTMDITETIVYDFGVLERHGIFRNIPKITSVGNLFRVMDLTITAITRDDKPEIYSNESTESKLSIRIGQANKLITGTHTYKISYLVKNGIGSNYSDHDEIYWNITGNEWNVPILKASASLNTDFGVDFNKYTCFTGFYGSTNKNCLLDKNTLEIVTTEPLNPNEGLTAVWGFEKGTFPASILQKESPQKTNTEISPWLILSFFAVPIFLNFILAPGLLIWYFKNKKKKRFGPPSVNFDFPEDNFGKRISPAEAGSIDNYIVDQNDITATIFDLAIRKYLKIEEIKEEKVLGIFGGGENYVFRKLKEKDGDLMPHEEIIYDKLFDEKDVIKLSDLKSDFYKTFADFEKKVFQSLIDRSFYNKNPKTQRALLLTGGIFAIFFGGILLFPVMLFLFFKLNGRTKMGDEVDFKIDGLKIFLKNMSREHTWYAKNLIIVEKYIPYALSLGFIKEFMEQLKVIYPKYQPTWYSGNMSFYLVSDHMFNSFNTSFTTVAPSSSSGFSGGGFSGGGGGGGGGGSW